MLRLDLDDPLKVGHFDERKEIGDGMKLVQQTNHQKQETVEALLIICILKLLQEIVGNY